MDNIIFMGHDGLKIINNEEFYFTKYFDWVFMKNKIIKRVTNPKTIYIKIDYLDKYVNDILNISNEFILVSGCSDASPSINYVNSYNKIIKLPNLVKWFAENNLSHHPKITSLTVGLATHNVEYEKFILHLRNNMNFEKKNKIFCCYRKRFSNCAGEEYCERIKCDIFIKNNLGIDFYNNLEVNKFLETLSKYKYCFCPLGNGVDHAPKLIECLLLKVIPICKKNFNSYTLYNKYPIIWIDDFNCILNDEILNYDININWDEIMNEFTHKYIYDLIIKHIC
jgi:hypothetical protein